MIPKLTPIIIKRIKKRMKKSFLMMTVPNPPKETRKPSPEEIAR